MVLDVLLALLTVAAVLATIRLALGPSLPDRVVALDLVASVGVALCALSAIRYRSVVMLDAATLLAVISFVGTVAFARYLEWRSRP
jgi:multicomponent Na+:H+ antiporter subunit F